MEPAVCIIGAGPAGLISAIFAAKAGAKVVVIEKNSTAGRKLLLTGGGRCNLTHVGTVDEFVKVYGKAGRFLRHCLYEFSPDATRKFFAESGVATKVDEDGCVFPVGQHAGDVGDALLRECQKLNVRLMFGRGVRKIEKGVGHFQIHSSGDVLTAEKIIIATGGASYPITGSTGDGYKLAKSLDHTIVEPKPALVPLVSTEKWCADLAGISRDSAVISAMINKRKVSVAGPMIFTHDGIGGPAVLDLSRLLTDYLPAQKPIEIFIDLIPTMNEAELEEYLMGQLSQYSRKIIANVLFELVPKKLGGFICDQAGIAETNASQLKKEQRRKVIQLLKKLPVAITATRPIDEATITRGGIARDEIDPKTMQSKICPGLYFAGEVIDADGPCGGYNLQIAWSTGALAGSSATEGKT
jgi:predicted Rossmann fold flavoprotein